MLTQSNTTYKLKTCGIATVQWAIFKGVLCLDFLNSMTSVKVKLCQTTNPKLIGTCTHVHTMHEYFKVSIK